MPVEQGALVLLPPGWPILSSYETEAQNNPTVMQWWNQAQKVFLKSTHESYLGNNTNNSLHCLNFKNWNVLPQNVFVFLSSLYLRQELSTPLHITKVSKVKLEELEKKARYEQYQVLPLINLHGVENDQIREVRDRVRYMYKFSMCTATHMESSVQAILR